MLCALALVEAWFTLDKVWKQPKCLLTDKQIRKYHTHTGMLCSLKKILPFATTWTKLKDIRLNELAKKEKKKPLHDLDLSCM